MKLDPQPENEEGLTRIGAYRLVRPLGRGGFASVWLAEHLGFDDVVLRQAAVKILAVKKSTRIGFGGIDEPA